MSIQEHKEAREGELSLVRALAPYKYIPLNFLSGSENSDV